MESLRQKMQKYDEYNHNLLTNYLNVIVNAYETRSDSNKRKYNAIGEQYQIFSQKIEQYKKWVEEIFQKKMKEKYLFIYNKIINILN